MKKAFYCKEKVISEYPTPISIPLTDFTPTPPCPLIIDKIMPSQSIIVTFNQNIITKIHLIDKNNNLFPIYGKPDDLTLNLEAKNDHRKDSKKALTQAHLLCSFIFNNLQLSDLLYYYDDLKITEQYIKEFFLKKHKKYPLEINKLLKYIKPSFKNQILLEKVNLLIKSYIL